MIEYIILKDICNKQDPDLLLKLEENWFFDPTAKKIYSTIREQFQSYSKVPSIIELEVIYGSNPFVDTPDVNISEFIIQRLRDRYVKTTLFNTLYDTIEKYGEEASSEEILDDITNLTVELRELTDVKEEIFDAEEEVETEVLKRKPIGFGQFDTINGGLAAGELMLLGGYRGTGKSFLSLNAAVYNYMVNKETVAIVSIEMPYRDYNQGYME
jgi:replicative DNA helicase